MASGGTSYDTFGSSPDDQAANETPLHDATASTALSASASVSEASRPPALTFQRHPHEAAWCMSRWLLSWVTPLIRLGNRQPLHPQRDVWPLQRAHQAGVIATKFASAYAQKHSVVGTFWKFFGGRIVWETLVLLWSAALAFAGPITLYVVVTAISEGDDDVQDLGMWLGALFAALVLQAIAENAAKLDTEVIALQYSAGLRNLIYHKTLRLDSATRMEMEATEVANLYTSDCEFLRMGVLAWPQVIVLVLQLGGIGALLYYLLDNAAFAAYGVVALVFVINHFVSRKIFSSYMTYMTHKNERTKLVTETLQAMTSIKLSGVEEVARAQIDEARKEEVKTVWRFMAFNATSVVMTWALPVFLSIATFGVFTIYYEQELTPAVAFTSIALFYLSQAPIRSLADTFGSIGKARGARARIDTFLNAPEIDPDNVLSVHQHPNASYYIDRRIILSIEQGTFGWEDGEDNVLENVDLHIEVGELVIVQGPEGCGKSSLCSAMVGDMRKTSGSVYVGGSVAYASEEPWMQRGTIRANILFGRSFDSSKYDRVLDACALKDELYSLPVGDLTMIGDGRTELSLDLEARIALARACYSDASIYVLDSPLDDLDDDVQESIFTKCFLGLLRNRTIIVATENPDFIASLQVSRVLTINSAGEVVETRKNDERPEIEPSVSPFTPRPYNRKSVDESEEGIDTSFSLTFESANELSDAMMLSLDLYEPPPTSFSPRTAKQAANSKEHEQLITKSCRREGRTMMSYYGAIGGCCILFVIVLSQLLWQGLQIASDLWVSEWSTDLITTGKDTMSTSARMEMYAALAGSSAVMVIVRTLTVSGYGLGAAKRMFNKMAKAMLYAPMSFLAATPLAVIIPRFSQDMSDIDLVIPMGFGAFFANLFSVACSLALIAVIVQWKSALVLLVVVLMYIYVGKIYLMPARDIERALKTSEIPILSHLSETMSGSSVIRAFGAAQVWRFQRMNDAKLDAANKLWYARVCVSRWLGLRTQLIGSLLIGVVALSLFVFHSHLSAAIVGLTMAYALKISQTMEGTVQAWSSVDTATSSLQHVDDLIHIKQEAPHKLPTSDPSPDWPTRGAIGFKNVSFKYREKDTRLALQDISMSIYPEEKIAVVGRSGSGKTSLIMALCRMNELTSGSIVIDDVDTKSIGLAVLRGEVAVIPQSPHLLRGTLRAFLNPRGTALDDEIWEALRSVHLADRIAAEENKLEHIVGDESDDESATAEDEDEEATGGDEKFSVVEKQLLYLARALLRKPRIVALDEGSDGRDGTVHQVLRANLPNATVLVTTRRLDTALSADRILVLDQGRVADFETPQSLVGKEHGVFFDLMQQGDLLGLQQ